MFLSLKYFKIKSVSIYIKVYESYLWASKLFILHAYIYFNKNSFPNHNVRKYVKILQGLLY